MPAVIRGFDPRQRPLCPLCRSSFAERKNALSPTRLINDYKLKKARLTIFKLHRRQVRYVPTRSRLQRLAWRHSGVLIRFSLDAGQRPVYPPGRVV